MSEPPKKKSKIDQSSSSPKKNINFFQTLFSYGWFLIEIGRKFSNDNDLLSILLLNKSINKHATPVFREHFLNFQLQKEIQKTLSSPFSIVDYLKTLEKIFDSKSQSLNPTHLYNIYTKKSDIPKCTHDKKVCQNFPFYENCNCSGLDQSIHLCVLASRHNFPTLVKSLLFHHRMNFQKSVSIYGVQELFNWAVVNGHIDVVKFIFENANKIADDEQPQEISETTHDYSLIESFDFNPSDNNNNTNLTTATNFVLDFSNPTLEENENENENEDENLSETSPDETQEPYTLVDLDWEFSVAAAIIYCRFEILEILLHSEQSSNAIANFDGTFLFLGLCKKFGGGVKFFDLILRTIYKDLFLNDPPALFLDSLKCGVEYLQVVAKFSFEEDHEGDTPFIDALDYPDLDSILQALFSESSTNKESAKLALYFAFAIGFERDFKALLQEREWSDDELFELFSQRIQIRFSSEQSEVLKLLLKNLSSKAKITEEKANGLLTHFVNVSNLKCFELLWNDARFVHRQELTNEFCFQHFPKMRDDFMEFLLPKCSMDALHDFQINENLTIKTEFRNCCFLASLRNYFHPGRLIGIEERLEIKWSEKLLDYALQANSNSIIFDWLLGNISKSLWNEAKIQYLVLHCCENMDEELFDEIFKSFPNLIDLNLNDYEAFRTILKNPKKLDSSLMFERFEKKLKFKNSQDRDEFAKLTEELISQTFAKRVKKMKLKK